MPPAADAPRAMPEAEYIVAASADSPWAAIRMSLRCGTWCLDLLHGADFAMGPALYGTHHGLLFALVEPGADRPQDGDGPELAYTAAGTLSCPRPCTRRLWAVSPGTDSLRVAPAVLRMAVLAWRELATVPEPAAVRAGAGPPSLHAATTGTRPGPRRDRPGRRTRPDPHRVRRQFSADRLPRPARMASVGL